jgi:hypothetical protein
MVGEFLTLPQLGEGVFIWGWKSGHWKQLTSPFGDKFGDKFGAIGQWAGRPGGQSGGTGLETGRPAAHRKVSAPGQNMRQYSGSVPRRSGPVPRRMVRPGVRSGRTWGRTGLLPGESSTNLLLGIKPHHP